MLKAGKLYITEKCAILAILFKNYFKEQKYCSLLLNSTKIILFVLYWKSQQLTLQIDLKIEYVLQARRRKKIKILYIPN